MSCRNTLAATEVDISKLPSPATNQVDFLRDIKPILETSCLRCHNPEKSKSSFRLDNRRSALKGGEHGVDIIPGNSAKSPLIHYTAHLVDDMEMPPLGKGPQLTPVQVAMLRGWIDQGVSWDTGVPTNKTDFTISPILGATGVSGDAKKFRELNWQREGANGGLEQFELFQQRSSDTQIFLAGHVLRDDYKIDLRADRADLGFIHAGWEQYRKYYDDTGGYYARFSPSSFTLNQDLYLDIGKAWIDFGLTLPNWPRMVLGYEYDCKQGEEATTDWGAVQQPKGGLSRNILPDGTQIHESLNTIKFDLDHEIKGVAIEDRFRGEFYDFDTQGTNFSPGPLSGGGTAPLGFYSEAVREGTHYFEGANTLRLDKQFTDWFSGSAGYLYSRLNSDDSFNRNIVPQTGHVSSVTTSQLLVPQITLERESQVVNANGLLGPFDGLTVSTGVQSEWTRQHGIGGGSLSSVAPTTLFDPAVLGSDYDQTTLQESLALRYTRIPYTALFAEARLQQQTIGQSESLGLTNGFDPNNLDHIDFSQRTDFSEQLNDVRVGFSTSPWQSVSFTAHYRRLEDDSHYNNGQLQQPIGVPGNGYPGFITQRNLLTHEAEANLVLHPYSLFKATLSYQYRTVGNWTETMQLAGNSLGGNLFTGRETSQTYSINTTLYPTRRLFLSTTFSYQPTTFLTAGTIDSTAIVPYNGSLYAVMADATYVLNEKTELFAAYDFSTADYGQNNLTTGLPLGIQYEHHSLQAAITRRLAKNVTTRLEYRFNYYAEPSSGGVTDYHAHSIFATLTYKFH